ncbi:hypothetical protein B5M09_013074 [Aphanomyces astaci]|uniref:Uncharacterized protein n=1 Tax=Aphanomyces astaci TaxID=112090 RepID=A0A3R7ZMD2_APHAT|nr:hypothetical protein B5M09_013074 [Aphanomyces astaci]
MSKLQKKIASLKKKVQPDGGLPQQQQQVPSQQVAMNPQAQAQMAAAGMFQNSHLNARNKLTTEHKAKQSQLLRQHQQTFLQQKAMLGHHPAMTTNPPAAAASTPSTAAPPPGHNPSMANQGGGVTPAQALAAQKFQQQQRALSRQNSTSSVTGQPTSMPPADASSSYGDKLKQLKAKYWDDLVVVCREFTRMAMQKPSGESQQALQQQERIKNFLQNLKRIMTLLNQDPTKMTSNNRGDLDRVEQHIERQVMPILSRLKTDKAKQRDQKAAQEAMMLKAQKAEQVKVEAEKQQAAAAAAAADHERKVKEEEMAKKDDLVKRQQLQSSVKLTEGQKLALQEQAAKFKLQQQEVLSQQTRAKSPASQTKLAQQAHLYGVHIAKIAQQLLQAKLAEEKTFKDEFVSIVATTTGLSASETFLHAIAAYAKDKPEVLQQGAPKFMELSLAVGTKLSTTFV